MIPGNYIQEWSHTALWQDSYQIREILTWFEKVNVERSEITSTMVFRYESETEPKVRRKLKIEINAREHFSLS